MCVRDRRIEVVAKCRAYLKGKGIRIYMGWLRKGRERDIDGAKCQGISLRFKCHISDRILRKEYN